MENLFKQKEKFALVIADRGDNKKATKACLKMLLSQTLKPDKVYHSKRNPSSGMDDRVQRLREALIMAKKDHIPFIYVWYVTETYPPRYFEILDRNEQDFVWVKNTTTVALMGFNVKLMEKFEFDPINNTHLAMQIKAYAISYRSKKYVL